MRRNFRSCWGEIDIVAFDPSESCVVFIEVKLRSADSGEPLEAVDYSKIIRIKKTAQIYLDRFRKWKKYFLRFDVIGITLLSDGRPLIDHIKNAF